MQHLRSAVTAATLCALAGASGAHAQPVPATRYVGLGATDGGTHQLVRTRDGVLYLVPFNCNTGYPECGPNRVRVYAGDAPGLANRFTERDAAHAPRGRIRGSAVAIDGADVLHIVWIDGVGPGHVGYATFNVATALWGPRTNLRITNWTDGIYTQGIQGVALAVDAAGAPHVVFVARRDTTSPLRAYYTNRVGGTWSTAIPVDDQAVPADPHYSYHPTIAFTPAGEALVAWIQGSCTVMRDTTCYTPDGVVYTRLRRADGTWAATIAIPDPTFASIDNGPTLLVSADGVRHITFSSAVAGHEDEIRYWYDSGAGWKGDRQPAPQVTHDPTLGPDGSGGLYIYGHGAPPPTDYAGYGPDKFYFHKPAGATAWSAWTPYVTGGFDDATSTRWSQFFYFHPEYVDATFWTAAPPYRLSVGTFIVPQP